MSRCKSAEEMSFYIPLSVSERLTTELGRQISSGLFEMSMLDKQKGADQNSSICRKMSCHTVNLTIFVSWWLTMGVFDSHVAVLGHGPLWI